MSTEQLTTRTRPAPLDAPKTMDELWHVMNMMGNGDYRAVRTEMSMNDEEGFNRLLELERGIMTHFHQPYDNETAVPSDLAGQVKEFMKQLGCLRQADVYHSVSSTLAQGVNWVRARFGFSTNGELA